jgi:glycerate kinase
MTTLDARKEMKRYAWLVLNFTHVPGIRGKLSYWLGESDDFLADVDSMRELLTARDAATVKINALAELSQPEYGDHGANNEYEAAKQAAAAAKHERDVVESKCGRAAALYDVAMNIKLD